MDKKFDFTQKVNFAFAWIVALGGSHMSELQTMQDALDIVKDIQIGDLVQG